ncbi:MAG: GNAT family N-acetyltransferase [Candidatus Cloacimonetes bacterium]|nr:GNAT family N-acetyltransferase [Candidatus Cloacimonadota bacterium]MCF7813062.1 GNAT family N-acetyltransferase [Candidatus Cloacimonadota bacterium]MCF7867197.1 GNAT family N-acetyltransferase [Candidatus Cloacimonadota bacterium]MCF7882641.1 GNAT family N-acetyltransferase [Candidatus Cloacimonadota bacterium]
MINVFPVETKKDLKQFIMLPFQLYKDDPYWVAPIISEQKKFFDPKKNPYYEHSEVQLFLAEKNGEIVGRISAQTNTQHNKFHEDKVGFFGFFECINDQAVANELIDEAYAWNKERGKDTLRGPMNFSTNDECGLLVDGFESSPFIMMTHNKPYYPDLLTKAGFAKSMDLLAYLIPRRPTPERLQRVVNKLQERGRFTVRSLSTKKKDLRKDLEMVFTVYTKAWERNWGFVPMTEKEFFHLIDSVIDIVMPEFFYLAFVEDDPVGFYVALPDYNQVIKKMKGKLFPFGIFHLLFGRNKIDAMRVVTMGVIKEYQGRGIDTVFYTRNFQIANEHKKLDIKNAEMSWILETNTMMNRIATNLGGYVHKTYRVLDKKIT